MRLEEAKRPPKEAMSQPVRITRFTVIILPTLYSSGDGEPRGDAVPLSVSDEALPVAFKSAGDFPQQGLPYPQGAQMLCID